MICCLLRSAAARISSQICRLHTHITIVTNIMIENDAFTGMYRCKACNHLQLDLREYWMLTGRCEWRVPLRGVVHT